MKSVLLIIVAIIYTVCPDLIPGPIDDIIVDILCLAGASKSA